MRASGKHFVASRARAAAVAACASLGPAALAGALDAPAPAAAAAVQRTAVAASGICGNAKAPCRFSTPSGNVHCLWTPKPNNVACVLVVTGRAYRLKPTGRAKSIALTLAKRGQTLPLNQQLVFPGSMSCRDTKRTMICNQDFLTGAFTLARGHSHSS